MKTNKTFLIFFTFLFNFSLFGGPGIWKSLVVPGWGEKHLDYEKRGNILLFAEFALSTDEFEIYRHLYNKLAPKIVSPSLVIFLQASLLGLISRYALITFFVKMIFLKIFRSTFCYYTSNRPSIKQYAYNNSA